MDGASEVPRGVVHVYIGHVAKLQAHRTMQKMALQHDMVDAGSSTG